MLWSRSLIGVPAVFVFVACSGDAVTPAEPVEVGPQWSTVPTRPQVPPPPEPISEERVREELAAARARRPRTEVSDFEKLLRLFPAARTPYAFKYLVNEAARIALEQPRASQREFLRRLSSAQARAKPGPGFTSNHQAAAECMVDFDDPAILSSFPDNAQHMIVADPYAQVCGDGVVRVEDMVYGHYHLSYEDTSLGCYDNNGNVGQGTPDNCMPWNGDPAAEPRMVQPHLPTEYMRIWRSANFILIPLPFAMESFVNLGGEPVKFRYRKTNGQWFQWNSLAGQTVWDLSQYVFDVDEIQITHASTDPQCGNDWEAAFPGGGCPPGGGIYTLDNFAINPE